MYGTHQPNRIFSPKYLNEYIVNILDVQWLYTSAERSNRQIILYDYQKSRSGKRAKTFLEGFDGFLQKDAFKG